MGSHLSKFDLLKQTYPTSSLVFFPYVDRSSEKYMTWLQIKREYVYNTQAHDRFLHEFNESYKATILSIIIENLYFYPHTLYEIARSIEMYFGVFRKRKNEEDKNRLEMLREVLCSDDRIIENVSNSLLRFKRPDFDQKSTLSTNTKSTSSTSNINSATNNVNKLNTNTEPTASKKSYKTVNTAKLSLIPTYCASINTTASKIDRLYSHDGLYIEYDDHDSRIDSNSCQCAEGYTLHSRDYTGPCQSESCVLPHILLYSLHPDYAKTRLSTYIATTNTTTTSNTSVTGNDNTSVKSTSSYWSKSSKSRSRKKKKKTGHDVLPQLPPRVTPISTVAKYSIIDTPLHTTHDIQHIIAVNRNTFSSSSSSYGIEDSSLVIDAESEMDLSGYSDSSNTTTSSHMKNSRKQPQNQSNHHTRADNLLYEGNSFLPSQLSQLSQQSYYTSDSQQSGLSVSASGGETGDSSNSVLNTHDSNRYIRRKGQVVNQSIINKLMEAWSI